MHQVLRQGAVGDAGHKDVLPQADVFSFGLCLWELLAAELPFSHLKPAAAAADMAFRSATSSMQQLMYGVQARPAPPPAAGAPSGGEAQLSVAARLPQVESLVVRAWDVSSEARPSFQQIVVDLEAALQVPGGGGQAGGASGPSQTS